MAVQRVVADGARRAIALLEETNDNAMSEAEASASSASSSLAEEGEQVGEQELEQERESLTQLEVVVNFQNFPLEEEPPAVCDRFVSAIANSRRIQTLSFWCGTFTDGNNSADNNALDRLFGQVIPSHSSLNRIVFEYCEIAPKYLELLMTEPQTTLKNQTQKKSTCSCALKHLVIRKTSVEHLRSITALANLLKAPQQWAHSRRVLCLETLELDDCGIESNDCRILLEALDGNTFLQSLDLCNNNISQLDLRPIQGLSNSNLVTLNINDNPLSEHGIHKALSEGLRSNTKLEHLNVSHFESELYSDLFEELLTRFNFTLRTLRIDEGMDDDDEATSQPRMDALLQRNVRVRTAHNHLVKGSSTSSSSSSSTSSTKEDKNYHVPQLSLWPLALDMISSKPALLYRFVRQGNLDAFVDQVQCLFHNKNILEEHHVVEMVVQDDLEEEEDKLEEDMLEVDEHRNIKRSLTR